MRRKKQSVIIENPVSKPKTAEQLQFESQWNAGDPKQDEKPQSSYEQQPKPTITSQLPPISSSARVDQENVSASSILFGSATSSSTSAQKKEDFKNDTFDDEDFASFDDMSEGTSNNRFYHRAITDTKTSVIPGLEVTAEPEIIETRKEIDPETIVLDPEDAPPIPQIVQVVRKKKDHVKPPPLACFRPKVKRNVIDIGQILDEPGRSNRAPK
jgi:hypothetical protein